MGALRGFAAARPPPPDAERQTKALHASARPLIALATQLRHAVLDEPEGMKLALAAAVDRFERELAAAGWDGRSIAAASYLLCVWVDEVVADTPCGAGGAGLLERFHGEREGGVRVLRLLSRLAEQPRQNQALLELFHACLSLGLTGNLRHAPDAARQLDMLRQRVFLALPREDVALAPEWHSAVPAAPPPWHRRLVLGGLILLGLGTLGVYTASHLLLAVRVDEVFASMQQLTAGGSGIARPRPAFATAVVPRVGPLLADAVAAGRLVVRDEANRSVVTLPAETLFEAASTRPSQAGTALLAQVGSVLARLPGQVLVVGHTDGSDPRSALLPSAWHQSYAWARATADALRPVLPAERLTVEGAADLAEPDVAALPRRRVDIVLYP